MGKQAFLKGKINLITILNYFKKSIDIMKE